MHTEVYEPWRIRTSENFMLTDFLYSDSIVRRGLANVFKNEEPYWNYLRLVTELLDGIVEDHGPLSVTYGYIHPDVSMATVKWKNPAHPSYHRWDDGAAVDIIVHEWVAPLVTRAGYWRPSNKAESSPMMLARTIAENYDFSRMIVYSESPGICVAVKDVEALSGNHRRAFYENRWQGTPKVKPGYLTHRIVPSEQSVLNGLKEHGWVGQGFPSYHGGGKKQYHHTRIGRYLTLLDCLRCPIKLTEGRHNRPPVSNEGKRAFMRVGYAMSRFMQWYYWNVGLGSLSVIAGHGSTFTDVMDVRVVPKDNDWGTGTGGMIFAVHIDHMPEFRKAWNASDMKHKGYSMEAGSGYGSGFIGVNWESK